MKVNGEEYEHSLELDKLLEHISKLAEALGGPAVDTEDWVWDGMYLHFNYKKVENDSNKA